MEKQKIGSTSFARGFHRGLCHICNKSDIGSNVDREKTVAEIIEHMASIHGIRAAEFMGVVYENKIGRPSVGDAMLDKITVPRELKEALEAVAVKLGITVAEARRQAYRKL